MPSTRHVKKVALLVASALVAVALAAAGRTAAEFSSATVNPGNSFSAAASFGSAANAQTTLAREAGTTGSYVSTVTADAPIAHWRFGEAAGSTTVVDATGNGHHGTVQAGTPPELGVTGMLGDGNTAYRWDASDARVTVPHAAALRLNGSFSIELWVQVTSIDAAAGDRVLIDKNTTPDADGWRISYDATGALTFRRNNVANNAPSSVPYPPTTGTLRPGEARHLVVTADGSSLRWYVDGALTTTTPALTYPTSTGTGDLAFLRSRAFTDEVTVDEPALYASVLSPARISAHYKAGRLLLADTCNAFRVYANLTTNGAPAVGVTSATADLSAVSSGATAVPLTAGSYTVGGTTYAYRSGGIRTTVQPGNYGYSVTWTDITGTRTQGNLAAAVVAAPLLTAQWLTGFEAGTYTTPDMFSSAAGGVGLSNIERSGEYSRYITKQSGSMMYLAKDGFTGTTSLSVAIQFASVLPTADVTSLVTFNNSSTPLYLGYQAATKKATLRWGTNLMAVSTTVLAPRVWYTFDLGVDVGANPNTAVWRVDGVDQAGVNLAAAAQTVTDVRFGSGVSTDAYNAYYDDIIHTRAASDYPIGPVRVLASRPNGMGTHNNPTHFQHEDGTAITANSFLRLTDAQMNTTTESIRQASASGSSYLELTMADVTEVCVRSAQVIVGQHKAASQANHARSLVLSGTTETVVWNGDSTSVNTVGHRTRTVDPERWPWRPSEFNALTMRIGYSTDINPSPFWDGLLLEYATSG